MEQQFKNSLSIIYCERKYNAVFDFYGIFVSVFYKKRYE